MSAPLLDVAGLGVRFDTHAGPVQAVRSLDFTVAAGEVLGVVGESGSGKSQAMLALLGLLAANGRASGRALFEGQDLLALDEAGLNRVRGSRIAMIFQDPMTSLNPYLSIGAQMALVLHAHRGLRGRDAARECAAMLESVGIQDAGRRLRQHPHELSGGTRQRVMIATALLCRPALLIADEPTTALDVTVQAQILDLMRELRGRFGTAIILITHDLAVVAGLADRLLVMQQGECREAGSPEEIFYAPRERYTRALLAAVPRLDRAGPPPAPSRHPGAAPLLQARGLRVRYPVAAGRFWGGRRFLQAVGEVSFELAPGEVLGVVGESGCGKSTLGRAVLQLVPVSAGSVSFLGRDLGSLARAELDAMRRDLQVVFQDPLASLDPRMTVRDIVAEPLETFEPGLDAAQCTNQVAEMLSRVGLDPSHMNRYPHQFSGGQCQRVAIARALITRPRLIVCDEAVSALDVSVRAQILRLLLELRRLLDLSLIFIGHDLAVIRQVSQRVMVMYLGRVMETGPAGELFDRPRHPYTRALLAAAPLPDPRLERSRQRAGLSGEVPSPLSPPSGCVFRTRCPYAVEACAAQAPALLRHGAAEVACHRVEDIQEIIAKSVSC
ncbi:methyl coenzyme M reductase system, component A2 [Gammaproteobacteria bacterium]|nr:methyl coenzyme M reductase system, component A2 [Gammaproteobacteria bacterium]